MENTKKNVLIIYAIYIISIILNVIPSTFIQTLGLFSFFTVFIITYIYKSKMKENIFVYSHMKFILKSIWVSSLILLIGMVAAYFWADHSIIYQTVNTVQNGIFLTESQINGLIMDYMRANIFVFIITLTPCLIYLIYRLTKGTSLAKTNQHIDNLKTWL